MLEHPVTPTPSNSRNER